MSKWPRARGTKLIGGRRKEAACRVAEMLIGARPGGRVGVRRASVGMGGGGPGGGGVREGPAAYGFVMYDASDVIEGMGSRSTAFPLRLLLSLVGDRPGDFRVWLLSGFGVIVLDGEVADSFDRDETWLSGGWL